jgi:hypothetical protein
MSRMVGALLVAGGLGFGCSSPSAPPDTSPATPVQMEHIRQFLKPGLSLNHAHVARSQAHRNAHFFAAHIVGAPQADAVGVWLVSGSSDFASGTTYSVDAYAKGYSSAPDGSATKAEVSMSDPPASDLQRYVAAQIR